MKTSEKGIKFLCDREGIRLFVYKDSNGDDTIGVGHLITKLELKTSKILIGGEKVDYKKGLTKSQVMTLLSQDLSVTEFCINEVIKVELSQNQFDALVSLVFNIGINAFSTSTLVKLLNKGKYSDVPAQIMRWCNVQPILKPRRALECKLWTTGSYDSPPK